MASCGDFLYRVARPSDCGGRHTVGCMTIPYYVLGLLSWATALGFVLCFFLGDFLARRSRVKPAHTAGGPVGGRDTMETRPPRILPKRKTDKPIRFIHRGHSPFVPLSMFDEADCAELDEAKLMVELDD